MVDRLQERLRALAVYDDEEPDGAGLDLIRRNLAREPGLVVARCARIIAGHRLTGFDVALSETFHRLLERPAKTDPQCRGKSAIVTTLHESGADEESLFLTAVRFVQFEPVFGGRVDTAGELRGLAALALASRGHPEMYRELARLLMDPIAVARTHAARILAGLADDRAELLLYAKMLAGDADAELNGEYFSALLAIDADRYVPIVASYLDGDNAVGTEAAFALGNTRRSDAFVALCAAFDRRLDLRERLLLLAPIAHLRLPAGITWLIEQAGTGPTAIAVEVISLLEPLRVKATVWDPLRAAILAREDRWDFMATFTASG